MKRKPKSSLTELQQRRLVRLVIFLVAVAILWLTFAPGKGIYSVIKKRSRLNELQDEISELKSQNSTLQKEIERIQTDNEYLEEVARDRHGLLREDEMVFDFSPKRKRKEKKEE